MGNERRSWTKYELDQIYRASNGRCRECKRRHNRNGRPKTWNVDHVIPISKGGSNNLSNLALTCTGCNSQRGNRNNIADVAETAARRALEMERNSRSNQRETKGKYATRKRGNRNRKPPPLIHITTIPSLANSSTLCRIPAYKAEYRAATCPRCIQASNDPIAMFLGI